MFESTIRVRIRSVWDFFEMLQVWSTRLSPWHTTSNARSSTISFIFVKRLREETEVQHFDTISQTRVAVCTDNIVLHHITVVRNKEIAWMRDVLIFVSRIFVTVSGVIVRWCFLPHRVQRECHMDCLSPPLTQVPQANGFVLTVVLISSTRTRGWYVVLFRI